MDIEYKQIKTTDSSDSVKILKDYKFSNDDALALTSIENIAMEKVEELLKGFYSFIFEFEHSKIFLHNKEILNRHEKGIHDWYQNLFCGNYDNDYFQKLYMISQIHVSIGLPAHYVNTAFSFVRSFVKDILISNNKFEQISSFDKIIDINLDILTTIYRKEEQTKLVDDIVFLKNCVTNNEIEPYVQGIYDAKTLKLNKYECLMRLIDKKNNIALSVFPFLGTSKKIKAYDDMMRIMVEKSFSLLSSKNIDFSINLSYEDLANSSFMEFLYDKINNFYDPSKIVFEILETDFIEDFSIVEEFTSYVKNLGCKIAIDDFGSGFSSMENILKIKPDIIKIDGSLVKDLDTSKDSKTIVKNIVNMAKELKAKTVAEYVHNKEILDIAIDLEVDYLQGFYLDEPKRLL
jgi:EAL domain-containing protein (putative c-di-GMP-specific phosphodiesterase class I)